MKKHTIGLIVLVILTLACLIALLIVLTNSCKSNFSPDPNKGNLYLILEANGFNVPELNRTQQIMDPTLAQSKFNKVVVVANSAKYKNSNDKDIMTDQWDNPLVRKLGLPVEKWAFVCCSSNAMPASNLITLLTHQFTDISGFLIDSEDDGSYPHSIEDFVTIFNNMGTKYQYGIIGGLRNSIPPKNKYNIVFDKFFSEVYTEGQSGFYKGKSTKTKDGATCVDMTATGVQQFWGSVKEKLGLNEAIVPTVCGSGDCQEKLFGDDCFDERLSNTNISDLISGNTIGRKDFAIWYGSGQQFSCEPASTCSKLNSDAACKTNKNCVWNQYKKNPTGNLGVCVSSLTSNWGCANTW